MARSRLAIACLLAGVVLWPSLARTQGFLVVLDPGQSVRLPRPPIIIWPPYPPYPRPQPRPEPAPTRYKIQELDVQARLTDQVAQVRVSQSFVNTGSRPIEAAFIFPLPYDGAVDQMTLLVDGKEFPAKLLKGEEARQLYEETVRKNRDPALLEWIGTGLFRTNVFPIPAGQKRTVSLRYSQLFRKVEGLTDFLFPLSTAKYTSDPVERVHLQMNIESQSDIKNVYSPTHGVDVKRPDERHATVSYTATNEVPASDFRLLYDVGRGTVSTRVVSYRPKSETDRDGFFLLLASPEIKPSGRQPANKTVVFVVDRSGSMSGKKIEQVRGALKFVLGNLRAGDLFNIIAYDSEVESFRPELQKFDDKTRQAAIGFVEGLYAGGSTNIDGALHAALAQLQDSSRPNYVIFLTDGLPTTGVTNEAKIVENAREANRAGARIFTFGVGFDVNSRLLDRLVRDGHGQSEYVRPNEDIEDRVSRLFRRIEAPVMTDVKIEFSFDSKEKGSESSSTVNRIYPKGAIDLFAGEQLVVVGRYHTPGNAKVIVRGTVDGQKRKFDFAAKLVKHSGDETNAFVEKLWAVRRVGEILDELDLKGKNDELVHELVELATRHGILTPYTSFLADEGTSLRDVTTNVQRASGRLGALSESSGVAGFAQRSFKNSLQLQNQAYGRSSSQAAAKTYAMDAGGSGGMGVMQGTIAGSPVAGGHGTTPLSRLARAGQGGRAGGVSMMPASVAGAEQEIVQAEQSVRQIGSRTFYRRNSQWIDSSVTKDQEKNQKRIKQFSDEYFTLAQRHGRTLAQYMTLDEPVLVSLAGQAYLIEP